MADELLCERTLLTRALVSCPCFAVVIRCQLHALSDAIASSYNCADRDNSRLAQRLTTRYLCTHAYEPGCAKFRVKLQMSLLADRIGSHGAATSSCITFSRAACRHSKRGRRARLLIVRSELKKVEPGSGVFQTLVSNETGISASSAGGKSAPIREDLVKTRYIAETLLPTRHGNFRLRGYKHSVSALWPACQAMPLLSTT
jgi:hypothetical protein